MRSLPYGVDTMCTSLSGPSNQTRNTVDAYTRDYHNLVRFFRILKERETKLPPDISFDKDDLLCIGKRILAYLPDDDASLPCFSTFNNREHFYVGIYLRERKLFYVAWDWMGRIYSCLTHSILLITVKRTGCISKTSPTEAMYISKLSLQPTNTTPSI